MLLISATCLSMNSMYWQDVSNLGLRLSPLAPPPPSRRLRWSILILGYLRMRGLILPDREPFYGGHIIRTHENAACLHPVQHGPATLPVFGGPPCSYISEQASTNSLTREQPAVAPAQFSPTATCMQLCAICYSSCCLGGTTHGLHACERHRRR